MARRTNITSKQKTSLDNTINYLKNEFNISDERLEINPDDTITSPQSKYFKPNFQPFTCLSITNQRDCRNGCCWIVETPTTGYCDICPLDDDVPSLGLPFDPGVYDPSIVTTILGCTNIYATNYNPDATTDDGTCYYGGFSQSIGDTNNDGEVNILDIVITLGDILDGTTPSNLVCPEFHCNTNNLIINPGNDFPILTCLDSPDVIIGCMDRTACNFNPSATQEYPISTCIYPQTYFPDSDNDGLAYGPGIYVCNSDSLSGYTHHRNCVNCVYVNESPTNPPFPPDCNGGSDLFCLDDVCPQEEGEPDQCGVCGGTNQNLDQCGLCHFNCLDTNGDGLPDEELVPNGCDLWNSACYGCMDEEALNYDSNAIVDDGSCVYDEVSYPAIPIYLQPLYLAYTLPYEQSITSALDSLLDSLVTDVNPETDFTSILVTDLYEFGQSTNRFRTYFYQDENTQHPLLTDWFNFGNDIPLQPGQKGWFTLNCVGNNCWGNVGINGPGCTVENPAPFDPTTGQGCYYPIDEFGYIIPTFKPGQGYLIQFNSLTNEELFPSELIYTELIDGCTDPDAVNYNSDATVDDGSCFDCYEDDDCGDDEFCNNGTCECTIEVDCHGDCGGTAYEHPECEGYCIGGNTGFEYPYPLDDCGVCNGQNQDQDCHGECFGNAFVDDCGICSGGNTGFEPNSNMDECGNCFGVDYNCENPESECSCAGCTDPNASNFNPDATINDGTCAYGPRDFEGYEYSTIIIGEQEWFTENLKTAYFKDGTPITQLQTNGEWSTAQTTQFNGTPGWCKYDNDDNLVQMDDGKVIYGYLYNAFVVFDSNGDVREDGVCPDGWRVPSQDDWNALSTYVNSIDWSDILGDIGDNNSYDGINALRECGMDFGNPHNNSDNQTFPQIKCGQDEPDNHYTSELWDSFSNSLVYNTNASGFTAVPSGQRNNVGNFTDINDDAYYYSTTTFGNTTRRASIDRTDQNISTNTNVPNETGQAIRCMRDVE